MARKITKRDELRPDRRNANKGTQRGRKMLEDSIRKYGAGRSILTDKDGNVIAGNKTLEIAEELNLPIRVIETNGGELVVVQRNDLDLTNEVDARARLLAFADNRVAEVDLEWDAGEVLDAIEEIPEVADMFSAQELEDMIDSALTGVAESEEEELEGIDLKEFDDELPGAMQLKPDMTFEGGCLYDLPPLRPDRLGTVPEHLDTWPGDDLRDLAGPGPYLLVWSVSSRMIDFDMTTLAFYTDDKRFEAAWKDSAGFTTRLLNAGVKQVVMPNYSLYDNMPRAIRIYNAYRSRYVARYFQEAGIYVIPDICWGLPEDLDMIVDGIPEGLPAMSIQIQTGKHKDMTDDGKWFEEETELLARLKPQRLLVYASKLGREWAEKWDPPVPMTIVPTRSDVRRDYLDIKSGKLAK